MKLSQEHITYLKQTIQNTVGVDRDLKCPICGEKTWGVADRLFEISELNSNSQSKGKRRIPLAVMSCDNCGQTVLFNALTIGLLTVGENGNPELVNIEASHRVGDEDA